MAQYICFMVFLVSVLLFSHVRSLLDSPVMAPAGLIVGSSSEAGYTKYLGVPYGLINESNPFGPAVKYPYFENRFEADNDNVSCPQMGFDGVATGTIQCLTLNIYVPVRSTAQTFPVMVWIHGGAFISGNAQGSASDPTSLLKNDVIVVAINYRLGIYGFMCLDTPAVPGNQGLKDQTLALRWIQENIAAFGGNVTKITLFGESAGGMSVNLHLFSLNEKLFNQVIIESGSALSYWMMVESNATIPLTLAAELSFKTTDINEALNFLGTVDAHTLVKTATDLKITSGVGNDQPLTKPCVEKVFEGVDNFITDHPMNVFPRKADKTPVIIGHNIRELAISYANQDEDFFKTYDLKELFKMGFNVDHDFDNALSTVRHFYFGDDIISKNVSEKLVELGTDLIFGHSTQRMAEQLHDSGAENVYRYVFSYLGASHGDELAYLFDTEFNPFANATEDEQLAADKALVRSRLTTLWTNFVKFGNPTPEPSELLPFTWIPITKTSQPYLNMSLDFTRSSRPDPERMAFWDLFYRLYGKYQIWSPVESPALCNSKSKREENIFITLKMADAGSSRAAPSPQDTEIFKQIFVDILKQVVKSDQEEKKPLKKKKEVNKKLEALKKKAAEEKAKHLKTRKEMQELQLQARKERANKRLEKRKSLLEKDEELIRSIDEKLKQPTKQ
ncbi:hypothetical protein PYW08_007878 [Mythimna loreyi]|uniref:Uncharacterized protein n=1 Tax=Mythimna loreyi TaxID=667449 RepID=A0ACC2QD10_9NEOP|nr:hypothetical protein PYW08_007878 [Mythimna loreyi]